MTDEQYQFLFLRLQELERVREIARESGDPAARLEEIRLVLGGRFGEPQRGGRAPATSYTTGAPASNMTEDICR